ncbi:hypothetical protein PanNE5_32760 [Pandoraea sp. NE5]|nr:hypothetical protein PanNE5_32760 [Pandoraea sp. NE5]
MHAVLRVDLQPLGLVLVLHELIHACRAIALLRPRVFGQIDANRHAGILEREVRRLVLLVVGVRDEDRRQTIERELPIGLGVGDRLTLRGRQQALMIGLLAVNRPWHLAAEQLLLNAGHDRGHGQALLEPLLEVARLVQLFVQPRLLERGRVGAEFVTLALGHQRVEGGIGCHHAALDSGVAALDPADIEEARFAPNQRTALENELRQGQQTARCNGTCTV